jgi:hypothetical protein
LILLAIEFSLTFSSKKVSGRRASTDLLKLKSRLDLFWMRSMSSYFKGLFDAIGKTDASN